jgi:hypothetical protein
MVSMKGIYIEAIVLLMLVIPSFAGAQPTPPIVSTLGPAIICSTGNNVRILSPQNNQSYSSNQVQLNFTVQAVGMFGQFGNIGYSVDDGVIYSVNTFINKTVDHPTDAPDWYWNRTTVFASVVLANLSEAVHNVTVYYGWQYLGTNNPSLERFEVFDYQSAIFTVSTELPPIPTPSPLTIDLADGNYLNNVSVGEAVHFSAVVTDGVPPYRYQWYFRPYYVGSAVGDLYPTGNTTEGANTQDFSFTPNATGHYLITVRVWDSSGAEGYFMSLPPGIWVNAQEATPTQSPTPMPSPTIPEFPLWVVLPLLTAASALLFLGKKCKK